MRREDRIRRLREDLSAHREVVLLDPVLREPASVPLVQADAPPARELPAVAHRHCGMLAEVHGQPVAVQHELVDDQPQPRSGLEDHLDARSVRLVARELHPEAVHEVRRVHELVVERLVVGVRVVDAVRAHQSDEGMHGHLGSRWGRCAPYIFSSLFSRRTMVEA